MTKNILWRYAIALCFLVLLAGFSTPVVNAAQNQVRVIRSCLMGACWTRIDVNKFGDVGCPMPVLIVNNVLREMNGYLANRERLNLSKAQVKRLRFIRYKCHNMLIKKRAELNLLSIDLLDNMSTDKYDLKTVEDLIGKLKVTCHAMLSGVIEKAIKARQVLTPEQRKKAKKIAF